VLLSCACQQRDDNQTPLHSTERTVQCNRHSVCLPNCLPACLSACLPHSLQPDHLDALATGTQLHSLSLCVYQTGLGGSSRVQLNPLLALTNLRSLEMAYRGEWLILQPRDC
jgi:hypothetical protein